MRRNVSSALSRANLSFSILALDGGAALCGTPLPSATQVACRRALRSIRYPFFHHFLSVTVTARNTLN